ncbi:hypothetical protein NLJ89_g12030 [Agrocybe chaxingu]|uniref:Uncharacterized protein n=1 Tax=Agrocybe chaxingu TaxID=84603 RepID=A0A9W8JV79_9AGAR|nr:hypothetical protein NLJ89_g12030 [Agrocybe chaxingu]
MVQGEDLGVEWQNLVQAWITFERGEGFEETVKGKLGASGRPGVIGDWIQRKRSPSYRPNITHLPTYEGEYLKWWASVQPEWRVSSRGDVLFGKMEGNWDVLRKPGVNGICSAMAGLFYWGLGVQSAKKSKRKWLTAVADCTTALTHLRRQ